jgi:hypothetical protein
LDPGSGTQLREKESPILPRLLKEKQWVLRAFDQFVEVLDWYL